MERRPLPHPLGTLAALSVIALAACNSLTGADQLVIIGAASDSDGDMDDDEDVAGSGDSDGTGLAAGSGSGAGGGVGGSTDTGQGAGHDGAGGSTTTTSSTTSTVTVTTTTTTSTPVTDCEYPTGGFGVNEGDYVQGNLAWQGYPDNAPQSSTLSIQDYFDCDGSKGIHALLIINSATWCGACQEEASDLPSQAATFAQKGIRVLTLMVENQSGQPATLSTATSWRDYFGLDAFATAADPNFSFAGFGSVGLPLQIVVDPRTMQIVDRTDGFAGYQAVINLANQNAN